MRKVTERLIQAAAHDVPVLLRGESGTGKSWLARALHANSPRRAGPLVSIDCLGLPDDPTLAARVLAEELGRAGGGTVFLEEVGALPERLQLTIASLLEQRERALEVAHFRFVAASRADLEAAVRARRLHNELLSRLNVVELQLPPLRDRRDDIPLLAGRLLQAFAHQLGIAVPALTPRFERALLAYAWPGNVRELRNVMQRALVLAGSDVLDTSSLPGSVADAGGP
jgi:DNA-binding NtrC family response regulator